MNTIEYSLYLKSKKLILGYLQSHTSATTEELITYVSNQDADCRDKVPHALILLKKENKIDKELSKEKKGFIWFLISVK